MFGSFNGNESRSLKSPHLSIESKGQEDSKRKRDVETLESMWLANSFLWEQPIGQDKKQGLPRTWALHVAQTCDLSLLEIFQLDLGLRHTHDTCNVLRIHLLTNIQGQPRTQTNHFPFALPKPYSRQNPLPEQRWAEECSRMHWVIIIIIAITYQVLTPPSCCA